MLILPPDADGGSDREIVAALRRHYPRLGAAVLVIDGSTVMVAGRASTPGASARPATRFSWEGGNLTLIDENCTLELRTEEEPS
ncbi:MAG TPA: hypothetical protein VGF29_13680 [Hyphomicrobiaceae bacterium]|jgi:hypothetical protein